MNQKTMKALRGTLGLVALVMAGSASAQATFTLGLGSGTNAQSCAQNASVGCTNNGVNGKFSAWATTSDTDSSTLLRTAIITDQNGSGIGINSSTGAAEGPPDHAVDSNGRDELLLINFGSQKVSLYGLTTGWSQNDTDVSLLRWTGTNAPDLATMSLTGSASGLVASGWALVTSSDIDGSSTNNNSVFGTKSLSLTDSTTASSWWIVSAYFGSGATNLNKDDDYFKLLSVSGCVGVYSGGKCTTSTNNNNPVPVPATLALAGLGLVGMAWRRRSAAR